MSAHIPTHYAARPEALGVVNFVADMTAKLEAIATAADLDLLAYYLSMATAEVDVFVRSNAQADDTRVEGISGCRDGPPKPNRYLVERAGAKRLNDGSGSI